MKVDEVEHVFVCQLSIFTAFFMKHPFMSFATVDCLIFFPIDLFGVLYIFSIHKLFVGYIH